MKEEKIEFLFLFFVLLKFILIFTATIGARAMIAVTETERGSNYGELRKQN